MDLGDGKFGDKGPPSRLRCRGRQVLKERVWVSHVEMPGSCLAFLGADVVADVACDNGLSLRVRCRAGEEMRGGVVVPPDRVWVIPDV